MRDWSDHPDEYSDEHSEDLPTVAHAGYTPLPDDARRLGFDRNTQEGAMLGFAGALNPSKTSHRLIAWVLLAALMGPGLLAGYAGVLSWLRT